MRQNPARSLLVATIALATTATLSAQLAVYPLEDDFEPTSVNPNIEATGLGAFGSDANVGLGNMDGKKYGYILLREEAKDSKQSRSNGQYAQFKFTQVGGFQGAISQITFKAAAAGQRGGVKNGLALRWSYDDFQSDLGNVQINNGPLNFRSYSFDFANPLVFGGEVTFRLFAYSTFETDTSFKQSLRIQDLRIDGSFQQFAPDAGPPTVTVFGNSLRKKTRKVQYTLSGKATDENTVQVVQVATDRDGPYKNAEGTAPWKFTTRVKRGQNRFFVRATDFAGSTSTPIKVTVRRRQAPVPTPTPAP